jgi:hypothetical protein
MTIDNLAPVAGDDLVMITMTMISAVRVMTRMA